MVCFLSSLQLQHISADTALEAFQGWVCSVCSMEVPLVLSNGMLLSFDVPQGRQCFCGVNLRKYPCHFSISIPVNWLGNLFWNASKWKIIIHCFFNLTQTQVNYGKENKGKLFVYYNYRHSLCFHNENKLNACYSSFHLFSPNRELYKIFL